MDKFLADERADFAATVRQRAGAALAATLTPDRQVGDVLKLDQGEAVVVVHDSLKEGRWPPARHVPRRIALSAGSDPDPAQEDTSLILSRVLGPARQTRGQAVAVGRMDARLEQGAFGVHEAVALAAGDLLGAVLPASVVRADWLSMMAAVRWALRPDATR